jgi:hypothetical protein
MPLFLRRTLLLVIFASICFAPAAAQTPDAEHTRRTVVPAASELDEIRRQLREQREELERLRAALTEQTRLLIQLRARVEHADPSLAAAPQPNDAGRPAEPGIRAAVYDSGAADATTTTAATASQDSVQIEERMTRVEEQAKRTSEAIARQLGSISFSGDLRLRYESIYGQLNGGPNANDPTVVGNSISSRQRLRLRARLAARGQIGKEFEWGLRLATGSFPDVISANQTLTDFFSHKNFALDQAYGTYKPSRLPGFQVQAGKFDAPWTHTELAFDYDIQPEGLNQSYTRTFKNSALTRLDFLAWQLPFLERASAFVVGANGQVNADASRRAGRDLALYGGQVRARFEPTKRTALTLTAADLYYSGTQFITPAQFFGSNVQIPVTVTIPATATTPAQTVTGFATVSRDQFVSGNANLGVSTGTNNAINRDGRLSSGFNLVDLIARLDLAHSKRFPVMLLFNFITNTQVRDVLTAGAGGADVILENRENNAFWLEVQAGKQQQRGDWLLNYTFMRVEKDAVLTPFNFGDTAQQSDMAAQRFIVAYALDPRVTLSLTGLVTHRPNGLLGVFGATPPGSLNRPTTRLQLDTTFRF